MPFAFLPVAFRAHKERERVFLFQVGPHPAVVDVPIEPDSAVRVGKRQSKELAVVYPPGCLVLDFDAGVKVDLQPCFERPLVQIEVALGGVGDARRRIVRGVLDAVAAVVADAEVPHVLGIVADGRCLKSERVVEGFVELDGLGHEVDAQQRLALAGDNLRRLVRIREEEVAVRLGEPSETPGLVTEPDVGQERRIERFCRRGAGIIHVPPAAGERVEIAGMLALDRHLQGESLKRGLPVRDELPVRTDHAIELHGHRAVQLRLVGARLREHPYNAVVDLPDLGLAGSPGDLLPADDCDKPDGTGQEGRFRACHFYGSGQPIETVSPAPGPHDGVFDSNRFPSRQQALVDARL